MIQKVRSMLFGCVPRIALAFIALTALSCSMQANLEEFVEDGISIVKITSSSYSQNYNNLGIVANRSVVSGSDVTVNLEFLNPEGLDLEYEIGGNSSYITGNVIPAIDPTGPEQNSVSFTFNPSSAATGNTITFTIAIRSPKFDKIVERGIVSIPCVSDTNTDIRLQAILGSQNVTYTFSDTGLTSVTMDLTTANSITIRPTAEISGQIISYTLAGGNTNDSGPLTSGESLSLTLNSNNVTYTLSIAVTPPCGSSTTYTIKIPRGFTVIQGGSYSVAAFLAEIPPGTNHIKLGGDIIFTDVATTALISNSSEDFYFDGNGHKISNLTINATGPDNIGFVDQNQGIIKNLVLENVNISCSGTSITDAGSLVGENSGTIYRCSVSGTITAFGDDQFAGGLVGRGDSDSYISECYSTASVTGHNHAGGLVGEMSGGTILNCYARGSVSPYGSGASTTGGLVGAMFNGPIIASVRNSYATNATSGQLIGDAYVGTITDCSYGAPVTVNWNIATTLNPAYVWGIGSGINGGYPYLQYFGGQTRLP